MGGGPTVEVLRQKLQELGLDTTGLKADLKKRLKKAKKKLEAAGSNATAREQKDDGPDSRYVASFEHQCQMQQIPLTQSRMRSFQWS